MKHEIYLCEECLKCLDPEIYCKFRTSCPIWFTDNRGRSKIDDKKAPAETGSYQVLFQPENRSVTVPAGTTLLQAALDADVHLNASCNGKGVCGKCKLILEAGNVNQTSTPLLSDDEKSKNYVLACMSTIQSDIQVRIPEQTLEKKMKIAGMGKEASKRLRGLIQEINPMLKRIPVELCEPTIDDPISDLDRLYRGLRKNGADTGCLHTGLKVMRELSAAVRDQNWHVTASVVEKNCSAEIVGITSGEDIPRPLGIAVDVGTTTIVVYLVDMTDGSILATASGHNRQAACGDDVINRIICAEKDGVKKLSTMVLGTMNGLIGDALDSTHSKHHQIENVVISGNTTMTHLLMQIEPRNIRREPYVPSVSAFPILKAENIGLAVNPMAAVFIMPGPASYVGGDIVSGLIYSGFHREEKITLFIDVGTNGEIVLGNSDWLMTASCSAGPAFEGGGVRFGMRAEEGAIEKITIHPDTLVPTCSVIGETSPRGICGSGMIDLIAEMLLTGIIHPNGKIHLEPTHPRIKTLDGEKGYIVATSDETSIGQEIVFTETDMDNIIRSKGAIYAGFSVLLKQAGMDFPMVEQVIITGGFGQYLDIERSIIIGLLPDLDRTIFKYLGNSSIAGAYMALLSAKHRTEAFDISNKMTYIDFSSNNAFMDEFTSALFLPHTNIEAFPSVKKMMHEHV